MSRAETTPAPAPRGAPQVEGSAIPSIGGDHVDRSTPRASVETGGGVPAVVRRPNIALADAIVEKIAECWARGDGIKETRVALKRLGFDVSAEQVRQRFVALAGEWVE